MFTIKNQTTQPISDFPIFNNWNEVALGWYFLMPSKDLANEAVKSMTICGQELVIFRGENGKVSVLDAFCPHMGTHLGKGKVVGNNIRCFFHHWQFDSKGTCRDIPCQKEIPLKAKVPSYSVCEEYDSIWVYPEADAKVPLASFKEFSLHDQKTITFGKSYERECHHHVTMINGIDPQHLKTVHNLDLEMEVKIAQPEDGKLLDISLTGKIGKGKFQEKLARFFLGPEYSYEMRYDHGNNGLLTLMKNVNFRGRTWPTLHMIFAYRPLVQGRMLVQPIYVTKKRSGIFGHITSKTLLWLTKRAFFALQGEDGAVYENMRFFPGNLLSIDKPIGQYIQYVNGLKTSLWKLK